MKNETPEQDRIEYEEPEKTDTAERYNEEMARNAAKSLFDDDDESAVSDTGRYVSGFERPERSERGERAADHAERRDRADRPERADRAERARREGSGPTKPRVRPVDDRQPDDGYAGDPAEPAPSPRRERPGMPAPRPAVKVNVASSPAAAGAARPQGGRVRPVQSSDESMDDEFDSFRQRYKNQESVPSPRHPETPHAPAKPRRALGDRDYGPYEEGAPVNMVRYAAAGLIFVFLVITAIMIWRIVVLTSQLNAANEMLEAQPSTESAELNALTIANEGLQADLKLAEARIAQLEAQGPSAQQGDDNADDPQVPVRTGVTEPTETTTEPPQSQVYTVVSGDNLSKIAARYYGTSTPEGIQKIRDANSLTTDNIQIGQELNIPE